MGHKPPPLSDPAECQYATEENIPTPAAYIFDCYDVHNDLNFVVVAYQIEGFPCSYYGETYITEFGMIAAEVYLTEHATTWYIGWVSGEEGQTLDYSGVIYSIVLSFSKQDSEGSIDTQAVMGYNASDMVIGNSLIPSTDWLYEEEKLGDGTTLRGVRRKRDKTNVLIKSNT